MDYLEFVYGNIQNYMKQSVNLNMWSSVTSDTTENNLCVWYSDMTYNILTQPIVQECVALVSYHF